MSEATPREKEAVELRAEQRQRWRAGERPLAESYLDRHPELRADPEAAVDLIFNEFLLREQLGESPSIEEYRQRFPEHAKTLLAQIEMEHINEVLRLTSGNKSRAARILGISRQGLIEKLRRLRLEDAHERTAERA